MESVSINIARLIVSSAFAPRLRTSRAGPGRVVHFFAEQIDKKHFEIYISLLQCHEFVLSILKVYQSLLI